MREFYIVLRKACAIQPKGSEEKLLPPNTVFEAGRRDPNIGRLVKINSIRKLSEGEAMELGLLDSDDDIIVVLD